MNTVEIFKNHMVKEYPTNMGPEHSHTNDTYDDLYRAIAVLMADWARMGLEKMPTKAFVRAVLTNTNTYFKNLIGRDPDGVALFDHLYDVMAETWGGKNGVV